jgi:heme exporter protein A
VIELRGLTVVFGRTIALDRLDLRIEPVLTGIFGPNGAGKSTLLRALAGLERPSEGSIEFASLNGLDPEERRRRMSYAGHASGLYGHLTVIENLSLFATLYGAPAGRPLEMIRALALEEHAHKPARELSAGLKRRAAVCRALLHDPEVLLVDEPYANVDDEASAAISTAIQGWWRPGRYGLVATHGAKKVRAYAHAGVVLQRGRLARAGRYTEAGFST